VHLHQDIGFAMDPWHLAQWWKLTTLTCLCLVTAVVKPAGCRFALNLFGRAVELGWLYLPLFPLLAAAVIADLTAVRISSAGRHANSWRSSWQDLALRKVQRSGPVFVKLGQWAATRPDLISESICAILARLHDSTEPHALSYTHEALANAFPEKRWFKDLLIEPTPIGSGCIAQVYVGFLADLVPTPKPSTNAPACSSGLLSFCTPKSSSRSTANRTSQHMLKVAVKVVHPQVRRAVKIDLEVLKLIAWCCDVLRLDHLGASLALRQFAAFLQAQSDLTIEAENLVKFKTCFPSREGVVVIPTVYPPWVSRDVLVMSFEEGRPISSLFDAADPELEKAKLSAWRTIVDNFWAMVFTHQFIHGDMHPGNILWRCRDGSDSVQLVLLDCGLVINLRGEAGEDLRVMVKAFLTKSEEEVAQLLIRLSERVGGDPASVRDPDGFIRGIAHLIRTGKGVRFTLSRLNAGALMGQSLLLGRRHRVRFDARFVNLMVAMVVLQGVAMRLNADGDFLTRMHPYVLGAAMSHFSQSAGHQLTSRTSNSVAIH